MAKNVTQSAVRSLPDVRPKTVWMISFGYIGVFMAFQLLFSYLGSIYQILGVNVGNLSWFFLIPPVAGIVVQPIVGWFSDRTWLPRLGGRRIPYIILGAITVAIELVILPNAGSFGLSHAAAVVVCTIIAILVMSSANIIMLPYKMLVGDMVNVKQKNYAFSIQSVLASIGGILAAGFAYFLTILGVSSLAAKGVVPPALSASFYFGAFIVIVFCGVTIFTVKEYTPAQFAQYHDIQKDEHRMGIIKMVITAPKIFWILLLIQMFCWSSFLWVWTYSSATIAESVFHTYDTQSAAFGAAAVWYGFCVVFELASALIFSWIFAHLPRHWNKAVYSLSLLVGAIGFFTFYLFSNKYALLFTFVLLGVAWASLAIHPYSIFTNALKGSNMGAYIGIFNFTQCIPQICAAVLGSWVLTWFGKFYFYSTGAGKAITWHHVASSSITGSSYMGHMLQSAANVPGVYLVAGILMLIGAGLVALILREEFAHKGDELVK